MSKQRKMVALFPGAFDPVTHGHIDIVQRASKLYHLLIVAVGNNPEKEELFTARERVDMFQQHVGDITNVKVESYDGLTVAFARKTGAGVILRGIRDNVDLHAELEIANTNLLIADIETVFLMASDRHALTSSRLIKQIVSIGGYKPDRLSRLVPLDVAQRLEAKLQEKRDPRQASSQPRS